LFVSFPEYLLVICKCQLRACCHLLSWIQFETSKADHLALFELSTPPLFVLANSVTTSPCRALRLGWSCSFGDTATCAASCSGVSPLSFVVFGRAPSASSISTMRTIHKAAARWSGVLHCLSGTLAIPPLEGLFPPWYRRRPLIWTALSHSWFPSVSAGSIGPTLPRLAALAVGVSSRHLLRSQALGRRASSRRRRERAAVYDLRHQEL